MEGDEVPLEGTEPRHWDVRSRSYPSSPISPERHDQQAGFEPIDGPYDWTEVVVMSNDTCHGTREPDVRLVRRCAAKGAVVTHRARGWMPEDSLPLDPQHLPGPD
jgi:hypothetical protein